MSEKRSSFLLVYDIYQSIEKIENFTQGISFDQLMADERTKDAILRNLQVIGEASKNLPESLIADYPEVDWSGLAGVRDIVTHWYFRVDWHLLWTSIHEELPVLKKQIRKLKEEQR
ncbi:MAG: DUF86 domain-containing protein [Methanoregula sp.]|nr:DUF86 domain-containing protein [Methanoregula sp.]